MRPAWLLEPHRAEQAAPEGIVHTVQCSDRFLGGGGGSCTQPLVDSHNERLVYTEGGLWVWFSLPRAHALTINTGSTLYFSPDQFTCVSVTIYSREHTGHTVAQLERLHNFAYMHSRPSDVCITDALVPFFPLITPGNQPTTVQ